LASRVIPRYLAVFSLQKVKELTYMHSEGIMSGELKHGPLALVDNTMPVIMIVTRDPVYVVSITSVDSFTCTGTMVFNRSTIYSPILMY
jgi:glucosamine 6-phosphate synthetase-like amidotransferase/phosphosugar isomerase protein